MPSDSATADPKSSLQTKPLSALENTAHCPLRAAAAGARSHYEHALALFTHTLDRQERARPDIHNAMLRLAEEALIVRASQALREAAENGERVWLTADLHLGHRNVIDYCDRPFTDVGTMDQALIRQLGKVGANEWLVIAGDVALGDHTLAFPLLREVPGRKVLVTGNHDITRAGRCHYVDAVHENGSPLFEAVVPFLCWRGHCEQAVVVSHYPLQLPDRPNPAQDRKEGPRALPLLNYHGHLHRDLLPHSPQIQYVNLGWDVTQGLVCL